MNPIYKCTRTSVFLLIGRYYTQESLLVKFTLKAVDDMIESGYLERLMPTPCSGDSHKYLEARVAILEQKLKE